MLADRLRGRPATCTSTLTDALAPIRAGSLSASLVFGCCTAALHTTTLQVGDF